MILPVVALAAAGASLSAQEPSGPEHAEANWSYLGESTRAWFDYDPEWRTSFVMSSDNVLPVVAMRSRPKPERLGGPVEAMGPLSFYWQLAVNCEGSSVGILVFASRTSEGDLHMSSQTTEPEFRSYPLGSESVEAQLIKQVCQP